MAIRKFYRGSSVLTCRVCDRKTRDIGNGDICEECWELAGIENEISDGYATAAERADDVARHTNELRKKGVDVDKVWGDLLNTVQPD
jgi:hypothetical protein